MKQHVCLFNIKMAVKRNKIYEKKHLQFQTTAHFSFFILQAAIYKRRRLVLEATKGGKRNIFFFFFAVNSFCKGRGNCVKNSSDFT